MTTKQIKTLGAAFALALICAVAAAAIDPLTNGPASGEPSGPAGGRKVLYRNVGVSSINAGVDILSARITPSLGASRIEVEISLATSRVFNYTAYDGSTTKTVALNGGTALTAAASSTLSFAVAGKSTGSAALTYNFQLSGGASAIDYIVITELSGAGARAGGGGSTGGGGGSSWPPTVTADLNMADFKIRCPNEDGTNHKLTVGAPDDNGLLGNTFGDYVTFDPNADGNLGTTRLDGSTSIGLYAGGTQRFLIDNTALTSTLPLVFTAADPQIQGPSTDGLTIQSGVSRPLTLYSDNGNGGTVQIAAGGSVTLNSGGNTNVILRPGGSGEVTAYNLNGSVLATGYVYKLPVYYSSATAITVGPGNCRSVLDDVNIALTSVNTTVSITAANGAGGLNVGNIAATATTHGTNTFEMTANIAPGLRPRAGNGTITTVGTALTGLSMNDLAPGDLVGTDTTYGWAQVSAWTPPTTPAGTNGVATLTAALPGGNATAVTFTILENVTIWPGVVVGDKRRVSTLSANGLSVVVSGGALTSNAAGVDTETGSEVASCWYAIYAAQFNNGSSYSAFLSTQRTRPYSMSSLTGYRRIGWVRNGSGGDIVPFAQAGSGQDRTYQILVDNSTEGTRVLSSGTATVWAPVVLSAVMPPTSRRMRCTITNSSAETVLLRPRNIGGSASVPIYNYGAGAIGAPYATTTDAANAIDYVAGAGGTTFIDVGEYTDELK